MLTKKYHTLYLPFPSDIHQQLYNLYRDLGQKYGNQYLDEKSWLAKITIGVLPLPDKETQRFVDLCHTVLSGVRPFLVELSKFTISPEGKYIFLSFSPATDKIVWGLRHNFEKAMVGFDVQIPDKYLEKWDVYASRQHDLLKQFGSPYEFEPHLSLVKFEVAQTKQAIKELNVSQFAGVSFTASEFCVSSQSEDPNNQYPVLERIMLRGKQKLSPV